MILAHELVAGSRAQDGGRTAFVVHGILGSGRNWRGFARRLADAHPDWRFVLPDLRNHGDSPPFPGPHTVAACAADLARLAERVGWPEVVVGHSFGGKVVTVFARDHARPPLRSFVVLDAPPGVPEITEDHEVIGVLGAVAATPVPAPSREAMRVFLADRGLPPSLVAWLLTSARQTDGGWVWKYDVAGVHELMADYFQLDLWPFLEDLGSGLAARHVRAGRSDRWSASDLARFDGLDRVRLDVLPNAGHWLQVDDPEGLAALLAPTFGPG